VTNFVDESGAFPNKGDNYGTIRSFGTIPVKQKVSSNISSFISQLK